MEIYVDEIPKDCEECVLNCGICCGATMNDISEENKKYCPLKSLVEHDKQVRKEVYDYIKHRVNNIEVETNTDYNSFIAILDEILYQ